jgi:hypothetical protein
MPVHSTTQQPPAWLKTWTRALGTVCGEVGIGCPYVVDETPIVAYLRPLGEGTEWQCVISDLQPVPSKARA